MCKGNNAKNCMEINMQGLILDFRVYFSGGGGGGGVIG